MQCACELATTSAYMFACVQNRFKLQSMIHPQLQIKDYHMNSVKIIGIVLIVAGILGVAIGGFSFTQETHKASLGPINLSVAEEKKVNIPLWASIAAIVAGAAVLVAGSKR